MYVPWLLFNLYRGKILRTLTIPSEKVEAVNGKRILRGINKNVGFNGVDDRIEDNKRYLRLQYRMMKDNPVGLLTLIL
ncbi:MAG TPA: hypothetical protein DEO65_14670 [Bacillus bacterium]|uniref:hypothetical protein n=1 Tax=Siminovitchia fordii TaxID=254759 RepID=UPI000373B685|nr:hypothetical protein [Siminovitchia fordii]HBZ11092.1 hypothetical protein [Bacillus sp. (in: firmicutes)]